MKSAVGRNIAMFFRFRYFARLHRFQARHAHLCRFLSAILWLSLSTHDPLTLLLLLLLLMLLAFVDLFHYPAVASSRKKFGRITDVEAARNKRGKPVGCWRCRVY